jgi:hypothetical protein
MRRFCAFVALAAAVVVVHPRAQQQSNGLPDRDTFLAETRKRLAGNEVLQNRYSYRERVTRVRFNPVGHIGTGPVDVYEVYPVAEELTYKRLVERNGVAVSRADLAEGDGEFLRRYQEWRRNVEREGQTEREVRLRREAAERQKDRARAEEAVGLFDFTLERRDTIAGQPVIVISFRPKPDARPRSREAKIASSFAGEAYVHEHEYQLVRVEADAVSDTSFGYGIIAKLHKGAKAIVRREKIRGTWLPVETRVNGTGRAFLFRKVTIDYLREYSDYRPFEPSELPTLLASTRSSR